MNADGSDQRQLAERAPAALNPTITPDGRSIVFEGSDASGDRIWRMDVDGASAAPITPGPFDWDPVVTPDQRWVYYTSTSETARPSNSALHLSCAIRVISIGSFPRTTPGSGGGDWEVP